MTTQPEDANPYSQQLKDALTGLRAAIQVFVPAAIHEGLPPDAVRTFVEDELAKVIKPGA